MRNEDIFFTSYTRLFQKVYTQIKKKNTNKDLPISTFFEIDHELLSEIQEEYVTWKSIYSESVKSADELIHHFIYSTLFFYSIIEKNDTIFQYLVSNERFSTTVYYTCTLLNQEMIFMRFFQRNIFSSSLPHYSHTSQKHTRIYSHLLDILYIFLDEHDERLLPYMEVCMEHYEDLYIKSNQEVRVHMIQELKEIVGKNLFYKSNHSFEKLYTHFYQLIRIEKSHPYGEILINEKIDTTFGNELENHVISNAYDELSSQLLDRFQLIYASYSEDVMNSNVRNHRNIIKIILNYSNLLQEDLSFIFTYMKIIQYDIHKSCDENIEILVQLSWIPSFKKRVESDKIVYEKDDSYGKYIRSIFESYSQKMVYTYFYKHLKYLFKASTVKSATWMLTYIVELFYEYEPEYLNYLIEKYFHTHRNHEYPYVAALLRKDDIFNYLNDDSHIQIIYMVIYAFDSPRNYPERGETDSTFRKYFHELIERKYLFHDIGRDKNMIIGNRTIPFLIAIYKIAPLLFYYIIKHHDITHDQIESIYSELIKNMDFGLVEELLRKTGANLHLYLYRLVTSYQHRKNSSFIKWLQTNTFIREKVEEYVKYKRPYMDEVCNHHTDLQYGCIHCSSFQTSSASNSTYKKTPCNPTFYVCHSCKINIHDSCLYEVLAHTHHRGKIQKCVYCQSKEFKRVAYNSAQLHYLLYQKILNHQLEPMTHIEDQELM